MSKDPGLSTNQYDPERYWTGRALSSQDSLYKAVCVQKATDIENKLHDKIQRRAMKSAMKHLKPHGKKVLEYGCGVGRWVDFFQGYQCKWQGVDISEAMIDIARNYHKGIIFKKTLENDQIPYPDSCMELVYSVAVLHHNPYERQERIISEMVRILGEEGYLILLERTRKKEDSYNLFPRSSREWILLGEDHGLICIWQQGIGHGYLQKKIAYLFAKKDRGLNSRTTNNDTFNHQVERTGIFPILVHYLSFFIDPFLYPLLPDKYQSQRVMVFRKT